MPSVETQHGGSMADVFYSWQQVYRDALNEPDTTKLTGRIIAAERVLAIRSQQLALNCDPDLHKDHFRELQAIRGAAKKLMEVKIERLKGVAPNINDFQLPKVANPRLPLNYRKAG
jgi:hypothetical protein